MRHKHGRCILWVGDKHSGKTTAAAKLVTRLQKGGYVPGGILAPSVYRRGQLEGFDIVDIRNNRRRPLAVRDEQAEAGRFRFIPEGLRLGHAALSPAANESAHLVIVDEYGPWELDGNGWRNDVDNLLKNGGPPLLLVVRTELIEPVRSLYENRVCLTLEASAPDSILAILPWLNQT